MQSTASNLEFKLNVNLRLVKPDFMQSTAVNLEFKLKVIFKLLSCNRPLVFKQSTACLSVFLESLPGLIPFAWGNFSKKKQLHEHELQLSDYNI